MKKNKYVLMKMACYLFGKTLSRCNYDNTDVISFDVFDTLVFRKVHFPDEIYNLVYQDKIFTKKRIQAELKARKEAKNKEITIDQIYGFLPEYDVKKEIDTELKYVYANPEMLCFFNHMKQIKKKIVIISDMYMEKKTISELLVKAGYDLDGVDIFVSSQFGATKRHGALFKMILDEKCLQKDSLLHIGDNFISDYLQPRKNGIKAFLYKPNVFWG